MKKFLYLTADAIACPAVTPFLEKYPINVDDVGVLRFDISHTDNIDTLRMLLNEENLPYDICEIDEFPIFTYSRSDGDRTACGFIRKRDIQHVLKRDDMTTEEKLARITKMVAVEKFESVGDIVRKNRKEKR